MVEYLMAIPSWLRLWPGRAKLIVHDANTSNVQSGNPDFEYRMEFEVENVGRATTSLHRDIEIDYIRLSQEGGVYRTLPGSITFQIADADRSLQPFKSRRLVAIGKGSPSYCFASYPVITLILTTGSSHKIYLRTPYEKPIGRLAALAGRIRLGRTGAL